MPSGSFLSTLSLRRATRVLDGSKSSIEISIHALLAESDFPLVVTAFPGSAFLSTLSLRRATPYIYVLVNTFFNFYPRSPCGERQLPTALRTPHQRFLSTLSLRRATTSSTVIVILSKNFYPRSPCGERHLGAWKSCDVCDFYPRSPCGERP